jgi:ribonuclease P protein component
MVAVPKRTAKHAVRRNLIKRQIRESFRLNKTEILGHDEQFFYFVVLYIGRSLHDSRFINQKLREALVRLNSLTENR